MIALHIPEIEARARDFFSAASQRELSCFLTHLSSIGPLAVFGGIIRDLALNEGPLPMADVDVVVDCPRETLAAVLRGRDAQQTKLRGWRLADSPRPIDIWTLRDTWALRAGHATASDLAGLPGTTFFTWDAVALEWSSQRLFCRHDYPQTLSSRVLEVNLLPNPNPLSMVMRALRFVERRDATPGPRLLSYLQQHLRRFPAAQLCDVEAARYGASACLSEARIQALALQFSPPNYIKKTQRAPSGLRSARRGGNPATRGALGRRLSPSTSLLL